MDIGGFLKGGAASILGGPLNIGIDLVGEALNVDPKLTSIAKIAAGALTANPVMIVQGAVGLGGELLKNPPAVTEFAPGSSLEVAGRGYAPADAELHRYKKALEVIRDNFTQVDTAFGLPISDGCVSAFDLNAVARDQSAAAHVREAANYLLQANRFDELDLAAGVGRKDNLIGLTDIEAQLRKVEAKIGNSAGPASEPPHRAGSVPANPPTATCPGAVRVGVPGDGQGERRTMKLTSEEVLGWVPSDRYFAAERTRFNFSNEVGPLQALGKGLDDYAGFLATMLRNNVSLRAEFEAHFKVKIDFDAICRPDELVVVSGAVSGSVRRPHPGELVELLGPRPPPGAPAKPTPMPEDPPSCGPVHPQPPHGRSVRDILNDPSLSLEEKIQLVMQMIMGSIDDEIAGTMEELASAQESVAKIRDDRVKAKDEGEKATYQKESKAQQNVEQLNLKLQRLMERRKQMFDLMSNMSSKFSEMAKAAIHNLSKA
ncbi:MAG: hypothetical protein HYZ28_16015 [Myxococcales bacterium]|nr:hypothetical protein [Myxococcales bacterium]